MLRARNFFALLVISAALASSPAFKPLPFWSAKPFTRWSLEECQQMLRRSPWSRLGTRSYLDGAQMKLLVTFNSAEPILLARAALKHYLPNELLDRVTWGVPILNAEPVDVDEARSYIEEISFPNKIAVQVQGGIGWGRLDALRPEDLTDWTFLRIQLPDREIELKAESYIRPSQSPTYEALFIFDRPQGVQPPGSIEFTTELPIRQNWKSRRFHLRLKVKFKLEEMLFNGRLAW